MSHSGSASQQQPCARRRCALHRASGAGPLPSWPRCAALAGRSTSAQDAVASPARPRCLLGSCRPGPFRGVRDWRPAAEQQQRFSSTPVISCGPPRAEPCYATAARALAQGRRQRPRPQADWPIPAEQGPRKCGDGGPFFSTHWMRVEFVVKRGKETAAAGNWQPGRRTLRLHDARRELWPRPRPSAFDPHAALVAPKLFGRRSSAQPPSPGRRRHSPVASANLRRALQATTITVQQPVHFRGESTGATRPTYAPPNRDSYRNPPPFWAMVAEAARQRPTAATRRYLCSAWAAATRRACCNPRLSEAFWPRC
jgi:hypothetical protein